MEPEGSLRYSQEPSTGPYPEPDKSNPIHSIPSYLYKIHRMKGTIEIWRPWFSVALELSC
jgi:hypothetical protein